MYYAKGLVCRSLFYVLLSALLVPFILRKNDSRKARVALRFFGVFFFNITRGVYM